MFPSDALSEAFEPAYNKGLDCPVLMYSLADYYNSDKQHCEKCKLIGDKGNLVYPSIVLPADATTRMIDPVKLVIWGEA